MQATQIASHAHPLELRNVVVRGRQNSTVIDLNLAALPVQNSVTVLAKLQFSTRTNSVCLLIQYLSA